MKLLVITNLFPPQELGGYGRAMADFAWGLEQRGHKLDVCSSDAPYLLQSSLSVQLQANVRRRLHLKGTFLNGVHHLNDPSARHHIDQHNQQQIQAVINNTAYDGVLLGNLDLIGVEILQPLLHTNLQLLHHIGYTTAPFPANQHPSAKNYRMVAASEAVKHCLANQALQTQTTPVVYPGARCDLFGPSATKRLLPAPLNRSSSPAIALGQPGHPLRICFAGLMMTTKSPHTIAEALLFLKQRGINAKLSFAGDSFQEGYKEAIQAYLNQHNLQDDVQWFGQLSRSQLARFFGLHHVAIFPSVYPEAFGIVAAEAIASGLVLVTSGVGGAAELIEDRVSGFRFKPGDACDLAKAMAEICALTPEQLRVIAQRGEQRIRSQFSVEKAAAQLEQLFQVVRSDVSDANKLDSLGHITF